MNLDPDFAEFKEEGDCPQCGEVDPYPGLYFARCCGMLFCWDCFHRKHEKFQIVDES